MKNSADKHRIIVASNGSENGREQKAKRPSSLDGGKDLYDSLEEVSRYKAQNSRHSEMH